MEKICLDFETALDFLRGDSGAVEKLRYYADREELCITSFTLLNLLHTINKPEVVSAFSNSVTVLPFDRRAANFAANLTKEIDERGDAQKRMDSILTAAICMANNAFLFSRSPAKFDGIKGLRKV